MLNKTMEDSIERCCKYYRYFSNEGEKCIQCGNVYFVNTTNGTALPNCQTCSFNSVKEKE